MSEGKRILVIEDEEDYVQILESALTEAGHKVRSARTAEEGLAALAQEPADLVILDVQLPDGDGFDVCRRIRAKGPRPKTPVLFCTVRSAIAPVAEGLRAGGDGYLLKPFSVEDLLARVDAVLEPR